jgi:hypothetical protein
MVNLISIMLLWFSCAQNGHVVFTRFKRSGFLWMLSRSSMNIPERYNPPHLLHFTTSCPNSDSFSFALSNISVCQFGERAKHEEEESDLTQAARNRRCAGC